MVSLAPPNPSPLLCNSSACTASERTIRQTKSVREGEICPQEVDVADKRTKATALGGNPTPDSSSSRCYTYGCAEACVDRSACTDWLFDIEQDPREEHNLASVYPEVSALSQPMRSLETFSGKGLWGLLSSVGVYLRVRANFMFFLFLLLCCLFVEFCVCVRVAFLASFVVAEVFYRSRVFPGHCSRFYLLPQLVTSLPLHVLAGFLHHS